MIVTRCKFQFSRHSNILSFDELAWKRWWWFWNDIFSNLVISAKFWYKSSSLGQIINLLSLIPHNSEYLYQRPSTFQEISGTDSSRLSNVFKCLLCSVMASQITGNNWTWLFVWLFAQQLGQTNSRFTVPLWRDSIAHRWIPKRPEYGKRFQLSMLSRHHVSKFSGWSNSTMIMKMAYVFARYNGI